MERRSASGTFNYTIPLTGGCGTANATGTITVTANMTAAAASSTPTLCISTPLTAITHTTTGATGIGTPTNLPAGVTAVWAIEYNHHTVEHHQQVEHLIIQYH